jgi:hypothetical protein
MQTVFVRGVYCQHLFQFQETTLFTFYLLKHFRFKLAYHAIFYNILNFQTAVHAVRKPSFAMVCFRKLLKLTF